MSWHLFENRGVFSRNRCWAEAFLNNTEKPENILLTGDNITYSKFFLTSDFPDVIKRLLTYCSSAIFLIKVHSEV